MAFFSKTPESPEYGELEARSSLAAEPAKKSSMEREPVKTLDAEKAEVYLDVLRRLIKAGRPNKFYPSGRALGNLFYLMSPAANRGLVDKLRINVHTGLPAEPEVGRVIADKEIAQRFVQKHDFEALKQRQDDASKRLLAKVEYYHEVVSKEVPPRYNLELKLKRVFEEEKRAEFTAIFQRFDPGEGVFTLYTIQLSHQHSRWSQPKVELRGDDLRATEAFSNVISRYSSDEAEFAFILLSDVEGITVEEVLRGRVGPLWMEGVTSCPPEITELLHQHPGSFILNFPFERVALRTGDNKTDTNRDPFARLYRDSLDPESRAKVLQRAEDLGYLIHKERKLACSQALRQPLGELLKARGKPCVIYTI